MFEQMAPKNSEGSNKKSVREAAELRTPSILYPSSPLGSAPRGWWFRSHVHTWPNSTSNTSNFEDLKASPPGRWRSSLKITAAPRVFTEHITAMSIIYPGNIDYLSRDSAKPRWHHMVPAFLSRQDTRPCITVVSKRVNKCPSPEALR